MRIFRRPVNPLGGTVNRPARPSASLFFAGGGGRFAQWHTVQQASSGAASGLTSETGATGSPSVAIHCYGM